MKTLRRLIQFFLDSLEALADDDRNTAKRERDRADAQKRWLTYLGSGTK